MKNTFFKISHIVIMSLAIITLYFSTSFWIGSIEDFNELRKDSAMSFFGNRFLLNSIVISLSLFLSFFISRMLGEKNRVGFSLNKVLLIELIILVVTSALIIVMRYGNW